MSGGFFRGTSADQDTRFSNKQAKLMKSQKFAPELEHLVNMTKVNMEVIKPWITRRVTELLGFEDEVLINFIHGLLDVKEVNGKEVQIQITGFMEKNTGKFMKELWTLLLSAQKNASGVPQQFLDAKEEEIKKKKAESERITSEIQRKMDKEDRENMQERLKKLDGGFDVKSTDNAPDLPTLKPSDSAGYNKDGKETDRRNGSRGRGRFSRSSHSPAVSASPHRCSPSRSLSKSFSNSRSYSRSRSLSRSPEAREHAVSSERIRRSPQRRSISPPRRYLRGRSPLHRASRRRSRSCSNDRSSSPVRRRVHSPIRRNSPFCRRRTPSPIRRRGSPSPVRRHRSPSPARRRRSPSPWRRRAPPMHRKSPSPIRRRSPLPIRRRSPLPIRRRSPSLIRRRSPSPMRRRSPSPMRRVPPRHVQRRSRSPSQSPSPIPRRYESSTQQHRSLSPSQRRSSVSPRRSPSPNEWSSQSPERNTSPSPVKRSSPIHRRSPVQSYRRVSPHESPRKPKGGKLTNEKSLSPPEKQGTQKPRQYNTKTSEGAEETYYSRESRNPKSISSPKKSKYSPPVSRRNDSPMQFHHEKELSPEPEHHGYDDNINRSKKGREIKRNGDDTSAQQKSLVNKESFSHEKAHESRAVDIKKPDDRDHSHPNQDKDSNRHCKLDATQRLVRKVDSVNHSVSSESSSEESAKHRKEGKDRRKHKRSDRKHITSDENSSHDSELEYRKEAKRRKKEERKLRKEEKRRRREERRLKREERHAEKLKMKNKTDDYISDVKEAERIDSHPSDNEDTLSEQRKLEIELRNKALESLKAKKGMNH